MGLEVSPENLLAITKFFVKPILSWPPPLNAKKSKLLLLDICWLGAFLLAASLYLPMALAVYEFRNDVATMTKILCEMSSIVHTALKMTVCRIQRRRLQVVFGEMEDFLKTASLAERNIVQHQINRFSALHGFIYITAYVTTVAFNCGPIFLPQPFPADTVYPFPIDDPAVKWLIHVLQAVAIIQAASGVTVDCMAALPLWFAAARFKMLAKEFEDATDNSELNHCILKHQDLIRGILVTHCSDPRLSIATYFKRIDNRGSLQYAKEVNLGIRYMAFITTVATTVAVTCGGFQLILNPPLPVALQFFILILTGGLELFLYSWPAESLLQSSEAIGRSVFNSNWIGKPKAMRKSLVIAIHRSQKPLVVGLAGLQPALSLSFYGGYLSTTFSYFTTLRAVVG